LKGKATTLKFCQKVVDFFSGFLTNTILNFAQEYEPMFVSESKSNKFFESMNMKKKYSREFLPFQSLRNY